MHRVDEYVAVSEGGIAEQVVLSRRRAQRVGAELVVGRELGILAATVGNQHDVRALEAEADTFRLAAYPLAKGHSLVIPRRHVASFFELTAEESGANFLSPRWLVGRNATPSIGTNVAMPIQIQR